ncbi:NAD-dependent epimerase/dehydratase family protein [Geodermatophilus sp. YIM 151500]|uniref:NAD-dependent epimerase/dehydratase family protein n=1 Tax=Geodermatophilus sp. YIM 151500 TaxID=2984531 RepID=UPI0021E4D65E|nr:NAD-dependent epimerase/dehydratase family protein [Geodermatophilus sp. YIM 151500]MCV2491796.1 NAD-dependent epimerase/dehydratase family protein [Geodermatophilus sp. YIM 151500]
MSATLLTGAAGFIGSHLAERLVADGCSVRGVDAFTDTYAPAQKRDNVALVSADPRLELVTADLARDDLSGLLDGVDAVVHLAGEPGVTASWGTAFATYVERNVVATQRLLEAATAAGVRRFVYASSSSVYGPEIGPLTESAVPRPLSPYGASKLAGEVLVGAYAQQRGLSTVSLRYFSVYGPRQRPDMAAHRFIEALLDGRPVPVHGDGRQARDFTYVADVVAATAAALTAPVPTGTVLNVARGEPVEVRELIAVLAEELGVAPRVERRPERAGDTPRTEGRADAARAGLGWEPLTDLRTGLRQQIEWHMHRRLATPSSALADALRSSPVPTGLRVPVHEPPGGFAAEVVGAGSDAFREAVRWEAVR